MHRYVVVVALCLSAQVAWSQSMNERLNAGYSLLGSGDPEGATQHFLKLQSDAPESEAVRYGLGVAQYENGLSAIENEDNEGGVARFEAARANFGDLVTDGDPEYSHSARYAAANCSAQLAKLSANSGNWEQMLSAYKESIRSYEDVLSMDPEHAAARHNLDHMRYALKTMLQNPPPEQKKPEGGDGDEEGDEGEDKEEGDQAGEENSDEEKENSEEQGDQDSEPEDGEKPGASGEQESSSMDQHLNQENIEAILQSLEDLNREEQKKLRRSKLKPQVSDGKWW